MMEQFGVIQAAQTFGLLGFMSKRVQQYTGCRAGYGLVG